MSAQVFFLFVLFVDVLDLGFLLPACSLISQCFLQSPVKEICVSAALSLIHNVDAPFEMWEFKQVVDKQMRNTCQIEALAIFEYFCKGLVLS